MMDSELVQMFKCCLSDDDRTGPVRRPRIDRSMIGNPTNFRHTAHVGATDVGSQAEMQSQMRSKGGYENGHSLHIINARSLDQFRNS